MTSIVVPDSRIVSSHQATARPQAVGRWLLVMAAMVFVMVVIGGITRLTESGLSITEWQPITGAIPPLTQADWGRAFDLYKATAEYQQVNSGMSLDNFKTIFFWEYFHRLWGRLIGLAFVLPLVWFTIKRAIPAGYAPRLLVLLALGGLQGVIGWWMVVSGLAQRTDVSHVRLAIHLMTALFLFGVLLWTALDLLGRNAKRMSVPTLAIWAFAVLALQLLFGAYVAGLNAGYAFSSWPLMGDTPYPEGAPWLEPALRNFVDNPITVQFIHRWLAFVVLAVAIILARATKRAGGQREAILLHVAVGTQILLGIATLMSGVQLHLAVLHQATAVLLVAAFVIAAHRLSSAKQLGYDYTRQQSAGLA